MTLREELKKEPDPIPSTINNDAHEEINNLIKEFLSKGGKIDIVPIGATNDPLATACILNEFTGEPDYKARRNKQQKAAYQRRKNPFNEPNL